jgi:adenosylhomocysteine nucleosidase
MSAESILSVPCLIFALRRESMYFRRAYPVRQHFSGAPCRAEFRSSSLTGKLVAVHFLGKNELTPISLPISLMLETGVGAAAIATSLRWCLNGPRFGNLPYRPRLVVSVGFSGALQPEQRVGDLVQATEVVDSQGKCWPASLPAAWADREIAAGRLLTVPELISDPQEKQRLGRQYEALAVDMESAVAARLCHQHQVPFACLRVISDDWQTSLSPHLTKLLRHGHVSLPRLASHVLRYPPLIGELWRLAGQTRQASRRLLAPLSAVIVGG